MQEINVLTPLAFIFSMLAFVIFISGIAIDILLIARRKELKATWKTRVEYLRSRPWRWQDAAIIILAICLAYSLAVPILSFIGSNTNTDLADDTLLAILIKTLIFHGPAFIAILVLLKIRGFSWQEAFGAEKNRFKHDILIGIAFYLAAIPIILLLGIISSIILTFFHVNIDQQDIVAIFTSDRTPLWLKSYLILLAIIVAPVVEEICFRGILLPLFIKNNKPIAAIFLVSLLFAFAHFHIPSIAPLAGIAAAFSLAYIHSGSLISSITMHAIFNSISIVSLIIIKILGATL